MWAGRYRTTVIPSTAVQKAQSPQPRDTTARSKSRGVYRPQDLLPIGIITTGFGASTCSAVDLGMLIESIRNG